MAEKLSTVRTLVKKAKDLYRKKFSEEAKVFSYAPGRVNLIGEHTDYNEGFVMPMALPLYTVWAGRKYDGMYAEIYTNLPEIQEKYLKFNIRFIDRSGPKWGHYIKGVMKNYYGRLHAFKAVIVSSVPMGGGLSSSAALEVSAYMFFDELNDGHSELTTLEKALACQKAEHFAGMKCGIMDQYISFMGEAGCALMIDCRSLTAKPIPIDDPDYVVLITNSNVKHELQGSEYEDRRNECHRAAEILGKKSLREADLLDFKNLMNKRFTLKASTSLLKRARHVITEIKRTEDAARLLQRSKYIPFGRLMLESHKSLKEDFEVSCPELDRLVELAMQIEGVLGSRMTGGGFGGCTVTLLRADVVDKVIKHILANYEGDPIFYVCKPSNGSKRCCYCARFA